MRIRTKDELLAKAHKEAEETIEIINLIPEYLDVTQVSKQSVFVLDCHYEDMIETLIKLRRDVAKDLNLNIYYATSTSLAVNFHSPSKNVDFNFYCLDAEHALEKISDGRCHFKTTTTTAKSVICNI